MIRKIIKIDESKCNGCGLCAAACHEGAIGMVDGVAKLLREDYCDGLGDCLPACPTGAITFEMREAPAYDEAAVKAAQAAKASEASGPDIDAIIRQTLGGGCPGSQSKSLRRDPVASAPATAAACPSQLSNWPVQIKLAPVNAPYFNGANLLIAADCCAYAYGNFHQEFIKNRVTLIGCPKLDSVDYSEKLTQIIASNDIKSVTIVRMEVPCCGGIELAAKKALQASGKFIPWQVVTISTDGRKLDI
ncbi:MAG: 4Fe-4S binding protein [Firmicutes bacterium]|nr:4Fe-4S binding protein [Bacillota bacterium]